MIRQRVSVARERNAVIPTGSVEIAECRAFVDNEGQLTVIFVLSDDPFGKTPVELFRFNRYETQKIRTVLRHTEGQ